MKKGFRTTMQRLAPALSYFVVVHAWSSSPPPPPFSRNVSPSALFASTVVPSPVLSENDAIDTERPLRVVIAGAGVGGLALAQQLVNHYSDDDAKKNSMQVTVVERTAADNLRKGKSGGPIQLASNALAVWQRNSPILFDDIMKEFTFTGDKRNGIKDGIRTEWYSPFDLQHPAESQGLPLTGVIERPVLQQIQLDSLLTEQAADVVIGDGVESYETTDDDTIRVTLQTGRQIDADVLIGADGIWSTVRAQMKGRVDPKEGATYSGYTVYAGELTYDSFDNGQVGYKVYIGKPGRYFVITDIGKGRYQWYAFLACPEKMKESDDDEDDDDDDETIEAQPSGEPVVPYLKETFSGWSDEIHHILDATKENEIDQRDLYDRPPCRPRGWSDGRVALMGDSIHAMMPNLGQGGCQAIEDALVLTQELGQCTRRSDIPHALQRYARRRYVRVSAVQGLSRLASDIIIRGFDTPAKLSELQTCNYAGVVTRMLQPLLPLFFAVQFNFLYRGWRNESNVDWRATLGIGLLGGLFIAAFAEIGILGIEAFVAEVLGGVELGNLGATEMSDWVTNVQNLLQ